MRTIELLPQIDFLKFIARMKLKPKPFYVINRVLSSYLRYFSTFIIYDLRIPQFLNIFIHEQFLNFSWFLYEYDSTNLSFSALILKPFMAQYLTL